MVEYQPQWLEWFLATSTGPLAFLAIFLGCGLLVYAAHVVLNRSDESYLLKVALPAVLLIAIGFYGSSTPFDGALGQSVKPKIEAAMELQELKLVHLETVGDTAFATPKVAYTGTAKRSDGSIEQFIYTQYASYGIYEKFDLNSFHSLELDRGLKSYGSADF